ncbi:MAG: restriction endonuclease subunit S [Deltaproteobacteria bacterium]|nr:restriction endonuclease subunit S [Deltaproteobacteria bacterium]
MKRKITEIADIQLGYQFRKKLEPVDDGTHWVIQIRDLDENHMLHKEGLFRVRLDKLAERYMINKSDVIFLSRGHRNWAAAIVDDLQDTVAVSHFFVIKIKSAPIMPEYLAWYINQTPAQEYLHNIARRGTHMPLIPMSAFKELPVEVPDTATQKKIVELSRLMGREKKLLSALQVKRSLLINAVCLSATRAKKEKRK